LITTQQQKNTSTTIQFQAMSYPYSSTTETTTTYTTSVPTQPYVAPVHSTITVQNSLDDQWLDPKTHDIHPILSLIVNFFLPGIGHVIFGQVNKGVSLFLAYMLMSFAISFLIFFFIGICLIPVLLVFWVLVMVDGWQMNSRLHRGIPIMKGECSDKFVAKCSGLLPGDYVFVNKHPDQLPSDYSTRTSTTTIHSMP
jgi:TM2 domain-containing membrane protein YozV